MFENQLLGVGSLLGCDQEFVQTLGALLGVKNWQSGVIVTIRPMYSIRTDAGKKENALHDNFIVTC